MREIHHSGQEPSIFEQLMCKDSIFCTVCFFFHLCPHEYLVLFFFLCYKLWPYSMFAYPLILVLIFLMSGHSLSQVSLFQFAWSQCSCFAFVCSHILTVTFLFHRDEL